MGQEEAMSRRIGLFDAEPMRADEGDPGFTPFFVESLSLSRKIKTEAPFFDAQIIAEGILLIERRGPGSWFRALLNLDGRSGKVELPRGTLFDGEILLGEAPPIMGTAIEIAPDPLLVSIKP
jgi:hypothetical protein